MSTSPKALAGAALERERKNIAGFSVMKPGVPIGLRTRAGHEAGIVKLVDADSGRCIGVFANPDLLEQTRNFLA